MEYGASITDLIVPAADGSPTNIALGYDSLDGYLRGSAFIGAIAGRVAGRITGAQVNINGTHYELEPNDPPNTLHSGSSAMDKRIWSGSAVDDPRGPALMFSLHSPDGDCGLPGDADVRVRYITPIGAPEVVVEIDISVTMDTPLNPIQHAYFNLNGADSGVSVLDHTVAIYADTYTPTDDRMGHLGRAERVNGTAADLRSFTAIRKVAPKVNQRHGDNYIVRRPAGEAKAGRRLALAASARSEATGISLEVLSTSSCVQFYTGVHLAESSARGGGTYGEFDGFCFEAQDYPDAVRTPSLGNIIYGPERPYEQRTVWRFGS